jgi:uncharacterized membrane protein (UPF0136 family)
MRIPTLGARRDHAERYLLLMIAAFALTVAGTRWFLALTGYPKVGGGGLHVAHMLWGGLLLVVAALLPLLFVGRRMLLLSALLAGVGAGLFIDEVGKFITESNDYFFAPAAPLIYGALLLLVGLWLVARRAPADSTLDAMQAAVDATRDGLDGRLSAMERDRVVAGLALARAADDPAAAALAERQASLLLSREMEARLVPSGWVERGDARALLERLLPARLERFLVVAGLLWAAFLAAVASLLLLAIAWVGDPLQLPAADGPIEFPTDPLWAILSLVIGIVVGVLSGVAVVLVLRHRERTGIRIATIATLLNLVVGGLLTFYVSQFGAVASTLGQVGLLALVLDHGRRLDARKPVDGDRSGVAIAM